MMLKVEDSVLDAGLCSKTTYFEIVTQAEYRYEGVLIDEERILGLKVRPPSSSLPASESSFVMCHISKLTNLLLHLPPFQQLSPRLSRAVFPGSPVHVLP